jgi:predicted transcriptional regulator
MSDEKHLTAEELEKEILENEWSLEDLHRISQACRRKSKEVPG